MNIFDINKRRTWTFQEFLKQAELAEKPAHVEKGAAEITKDAMDGGEKGKPGYETQLDEPKTEKGKHDATKATYAGDEKGKAGYETELDKPVVEGEVPQVEKKTELEGYWLNEREFSQARREKLADKGYALPDGSFPIVTAADLKAAIKAHGRAKDKKKVEAHIKKRAKALGKSDLIPADWK